MIVAVECEACGSDVPFHIEGQEAGPTETCDECGAVYRLTVKRV